MKRSYPISAVRMALCTALFVWGLCGSVQASLCQTCAYVTGNGAVNSWDPVANQLTTVATSPQGDLDSLIFDTHGNIIFDSDQSNNVYLYNSTTGNITTLVSNLGNQLGDMALEPAGGSFLLSSRGSGTIYRINLTTNASSVFYSGLRPDGVIYDNTGRLFAVLGQSEVAQLDPTTGAVIKQITGLTKGADGLTFSTTTLKLYVGGGSGFYTVPTDLSSAVFTDLGSNGVNSADGVGTAGNFLYLINWGVCSGGSANTGSGCGHAYQYDLTKGQVSAMSAPLNEADDIAPLSGLGSQSPAPTITFSANPTTISSGGSSTLSWTIINANSASIDQGIGSVSATSGSLPVSPTTTTTYTLSASGPGGTSSAQATVTVSGTPPPPPPPPPPPSTSVQFNSPTYSATEGSGTSLITVTRSGDTSGASSVQYATSNGSAVAGTDYVNVSGTLKFAALDTSETFNVPILVNPAASGPVTVNLTLSNPTGASLGSPSQAVLTISPETPTPPSPPSPFISQLVPFSAPAGYGSSFKMEVLGSGFASGATVLWNGSTAGLTITSSTSTEIDVTVSPSLVATAGSYPVMVQNPGPVNSNSATFTVTPVGSGNAPPTAYKPTANPNPTPTRQTLLSEVAVSNTGGALNYTWMLTGNNPSTNVTFSPGNAANTTATFPMLGTYHIFVRVQDQNNLASIDSPAVDVTVVQTPTTIVVSPHNENYILGQSQPVNISAIVQDQFGVTMNVTPTWSNDSGLPSESGASASYTISDVSHPTVTFTAHYLSAKPDSDVVSIYAAGSGVGALFNAKPFPVPWKSGGTQNYITFTGLIPGARIRLFSTGGRLVQTLFSDAIGDNVLWYINNSNGDRVASGVYLYIIDGSGQKKEGKVVVIQ